MTNQELYNSLFEYDNGRLIWKTKTSNLSTRSIIGSEAGVLSHNKKNNTAYYRVGINGKLLALHRVIWIMHYGDIPEGMQIDHISHDTLDNRIENLRLVTGKDNCKNKSKMSNNTSGYNNIYIINRKKQYQVGFKGEKNYTKSFLTLEEAIQHRDEKYIEFGFHENHGL
jgi:hypothetical protein